MTLSTATPDGRPSARIVLLRGFDARGFCFFTNYESRKGRELTANPHASLTFHWADARAAGADRGPRRADDRRRVGRLFPHAAEHVADRGLELAAERGDPRPRGARGPLRPLPRAEHPDDAAIPRPSNWGGFRLVPERIEFWQGRPSRLHDRLRFRRGSGGAWTVERLAP